MKDLHQLHIELSDLYQLRIKLYDCNGGGGGGGGGLYKFIQYHINM